MGDLVSQALQQIGLTDADVQKGTITTGGTAGPTYLSSNPQFSSAIPAKTIVINSVEELKAIVGAKAASSSQLGAVPAPWPQDKNTLQKHELTESDELDVYSALRAIVLGHSDAVNSYTGIVNARYFPMSATAYAGEDIVVTANNPLIIEPHGHDPVIVTFNTVTLEQGGQIICDAPVIMTVNTFTKQ
ncbi:hypothetical protein K0T92_05020 [Paenibacillus oenotherae]|uniref:Uncharacterized protein n=1 Tax=Paenibacillus oenotherae TaxID=1435645 RepID=A0ABS7D2C8_9BACL|nr:hypothetical protein [Paenibacillus oenotherae]MBW7474095.1 hypothetical protein [Paenibacillus oenotherae]